MTPMKHENIIESLGEAHARDGGDGEERLQHQHRDWRFASASALHFIVCISVTSRHEYQHHP
jgi:hypothetical protein